MGAKIIVISALILGLFSGVALSDNHIRDPFATLANAPDKPETQSLIDIDRPVTTRDLELRAVLWGSHPLANISGMIVAEGDRVHDYTVQQLSRKTAVLRQADKTILLVLEEDS